MLIEPGKLLADIKTPADLRQLKPEQLPQLCDELRQFIIDSVSVYGGHFGASFNNGTAIRISIAKPGRGQRENSSNEASVAVSTHESTTFPKNEPGLLRVAGKIPSGAGAALALA